MDLHFIIENIQPKLNKLIKSGFSIISNNSLDCLDTVAHILVYSDNYYILNQRIDAYQNINYLKIPYFDKKIIKICTCLSHQEINITYDKSDMEYLMMDLIDNGHTLIRYDCSYNIDSDKFIYKATVNYTKPFYDSTDHYKLLEVMKERGFKGQFSMESNYVVFTFEY